MRKTPVVFAAVLAMNLAVRAAQQGTASEPKARTLVLALVDVDLNGHSTSTVSLTRNDGLNTSEGAAAAAGKAGKSGKAPGKAGQDQTRFRSAVIDGANYSLSENLTVEDLDRLEAQITKLRTVVKKSGKSK